MRFKMLLPVLFLIPLVGCGGEKPSVPPTEPAIKVRIETVAPSPTAETYDATGTVRSSVSTVVSSKLVGNVVAVHVREGDRVKAGQLLVEIDARDIAAQNRKAEAGLNEARGSINEIERAIKAGEAAKTAAEANRDLANSTHERYRRLLERKSVSRQEFEEVEARWKASNAEVVRADETLESLRAKREQALAASDRVKADIAETQIMLGYSRLTAPTAGVVTAKSVEVGTLAMPGMPLLTVEDAGTFRLEANVEEQRLSKIRVGQSVGVTLDSLGSEPLAGKVVEIVPTVDPNSRSFTVKIELPTDARIRSGMFGKARFSVGETTALTVPVAALVERGQLTSVFVVETDDTVRMRLVKTGKSFGERIEILSGLNAGERIVVSEVSRLRDGNRVTG